MLTKAQTLAGANYTQGHGRITNKGMVMLQTKAWQNCKKNDQIKRKKWHYQIINKELTKLQTMS